MIPSDISKKQNCGRNGGIWNPEAEARYTERRDEILKENVTAERLRPQTTKVWLKKKKLDSRTCETTYEQWCKEYLDNYMDVSQKFGFIPQWLDDERDGFVIYQA